MPRIKIFKLKLEYVFLPYKLINLFRKSVHMLYRLTKMLQGNHFYSGQHFPKIPFSFHAPQIPFNASENHKVKCFWFRICLYLIYISWEPVSLQKLWMKEGTFSILFILTICFIYFNIFNIYLFIVSWVSPNEF